MPPKLLLALLIAGAFGCDRTPKGEQAGESVATLATPEEDRSLENDGCAINFAYRQPYYTRDDGFRPLPIVRDSTPGQLVIESIASGVPTVAVDIAGRVYRYPQGEAGAVKYTLAGQVEDRVLRRVLATRRSASAAPFRSFAGPFHCFETSTSREIRLGGPDPALGSPPVLASADPSVASRRVSKDADALARWMLSIHTRALMVTPICDINQGAGDCGP